MSPFRYQLALKNLQYIVYLIYRLSFLDETIFIAPPVKALTEDQVHYLNILGPRGLSAFNFRSLCERCCEAIKLKLVVYCSDSFD